MTTVAQRNDIKDMSYIIAKVMVILIGLFATSYASLGMDRSNHSTFDGVADSPPPSYLSGVSLIISPSNLFACRGLSVHGTMQFSMRAFSVPLQGSTILAPSLDASISCVFTLPAGVVYTMNSRRGFVKFRNQFDLLAVATALEYDGFRHVLFPSKKEVFRAACESNFVGGSVSILPRSFTSSTFLWRILS